MNIGMRPVYFGVIGQGLTMKDTPVDIKQGKLSVIRKDQSTARLSRDVWMVEDTATGQKYSLFLADPGPNAKNLDDLYVKTAGWGEGTLINVKGTASKPVAMQRFPFLMVDSIEKA